MSKNVSAVVRFKVKGEDAYILAWTTTPWTLPSNVALCVNPDEDYVKVTSKGYTYYMAAALVDTVLGEGAEFWSIIRAKISSSKSTSRCSRTLRRESETKKHTM